MKDHKSVLKLFSCFDRTGIEEYLARQAAEGWMVEKFGMAGFRFKKSEKKKLTFSVVYYPGASEFDPAPTEEELTFRDFCEHAGWILAASNGKILIFYTEKTNAVPIQTDPSLELSSITKTMIPYAAVSVLYLFIGLVYQCLIAIILMVSPISFFSNTALLFSEAFFLIGIGTVLADLIMGLIWFIRAKKAVKLEAETLPSGGFGRLSAISITLIIAAVGLDFFSFSGRISSLFPYLIGFLLIVVSVFLIMRFLKNLQCSKRLNIVVTTAFSIFFSVLFSLVLIFGIKDYYGSRHHKVNYEANGKTRTGYEDPIPLRLQDLYTLEDLNYDYTLNQERNSFFLGLVDAKQHVRLMGAGKVPHPNYLGYTVVNVKNPLLYSMCRKELENSLTSNYGKPVEYDPDFEKHVQVDATPWGANEAYQLYLYEEPQDCYILCYDKHIVKVMIWGTEEHPVTPEVKSTIAEKLTSL